MSSSSLAQVSIPDRACRRLRTVSSRSSSLCTSGSPGAVNSCTPVAQRTLGDRHRAAGGVLPAVPVGNAVGDEQRQPVGDPVARYVEAVAALAGASTLLAPAHAAGFPDRPITLVVPYPPGGATDTLARILNTALSQRLGQPVIVDNKPGAGTAIGATAVARAEPDGHTLLISSNTTFTVNAAPSTDATPNNTFTPDTSESSSPLPYDPFGPDRDLSHLGSLTANMHHRPAIGVDAPPAGLLVQQSVSLLARFLLLS